MHEARNRASVAGRTWAYPDQVCLFRHCRTYSKYALEATQEPRQSGSDVPAIIELIGGGGHVASPLPHLPSHGPRVVRFRVPCARAPRSYCGRDIRVRYRAAAALRLRRRARAGTCLAKDGTRPADRERTYDRCAGEPSLHSFVGITGRSFQGGRSVPAAAIAT
jgi:hypothetical protein